ncbi:MAG: hypothetical protein Q9226_006242 [Calogaya cf. arnoldii]
MSSKLVFINTNNPHDLKSSAQRKAVRSQAAKDHSLPSSSRDDVPKRRRHKKMLTVELEVATDESDASRSESPPSLVDEFPWLSQEIEDVDYSPILPMGNFFVPSPEGMAFSSILSHYVSAMTVDIRELDDARAEGSLRSLWFPMAASEQAKLNCKPEVLEKMKQQAITAINRGLQDPTLATSDQLIGAVAKMAAYEAGFAGDEGQYHMHMKGLVKMVELRGGLGSLGLNGLLARMLFWIDRNAAFLLQTHLYFPGQKSRPGQS